MSSNGSGSWWGRTSSDSSNSLNGLRAPDPDTTFEVSKKQNVFHSARRILVVDIENRQLLQHNEDMTLRSAVPLSDVTEFGVKDHAKPLLLHIEMKGKGKESKLEFKDERKLNRFIELLRSPKDDAGEIETSNDAGQSGGARATSEETATTTTTAKRSAQATVRSASTPTPAREKQQPPHKDAAVPDNSPPPHSAHRNGAAEGSPESPTRPPTNAGAWPTNARIAMVGGSPGSSFTGSNNTINGLRPSDVPIKNSFLRRAHTSQPGQSVKNGIVSSLAAVDENAQIADMTDLNGHGNGLSGAVLPHIAEPSPSFKQQRLRHEDSLKKDYSKTPIQRYDPTDLYCGNKTIATVSAGMVVVAYPKAYLTGRAAIKQLRVGSGDNIEDLMTEVYAMSVSKHPNIIDFFNSYMWTDAHGIQNLWIVMEFMPYGSLTACLEDAWDEWSERPEVEDVAAYVVREVATGLAYLHSYHRLHRDIKSDNIFVGIGGIVKIGDLGCCVHLTQERQKRSEMQGTANWMAPECIMQKPYDSKIDVWSLGVTLIEMCQRDPPYFDETVYQAMYLICKHGVPELDEPERWSDELQDFLKVCTRMDPTQRPTSVALLEHPWLTRAVEPDYFETVVRECLHLPKVSGGKHSSTQLSREHLLMLKRSGTV